MKEDPHTVAGLIANGGSCLDWQTMTLDAMSATMFTQSVMVVDKMLAIRNGLPGNVLLRPEPLERAHKMGENIIAAIQTPVEERHWMGEPDVGLCPNCHSHLVYRGEPHWEGIHFPFECAVCGAGGDLVKTEDGQIRFILAENGLIRDRNNNDARAEHLNEIVKTRIEYLSRKHETSDLAKHYRSIKFPGI